MSHRKVIVVGAGVFGLSTALHLTKQGYTAVTVLDSQPHDRQHYSPDLGSRSASADLNKVFRASYGAAVDYQNLAYEAKEVWLRWNEEIASAGNAALPEGLSREDKLLQLSGMLRLSTSGSLSRHELDTLENLTSKGFRGMQYSLSDPADQKRVADEPWHAQFCALGDPATEGGKAKVGVLDTTAGFVMASKACIWALELCRRAGVKFILGDAGRVTSFVQEHANGVRKISGVRTADETTHHADLVILASGAHTPLLLPLTSPILTGTAGSLLTIALPRSRPDLWDRFSPERFPVVTWGMTDGPSSGLYLLPRSPDGLLKFGFRGIKYTNKSNSDVSSPVYPETLPPPGIQVAQRTIQQYLPELADLPFASTRLCWYTDGTNDDFLVDYVPGYAGLVVATGGSGHAFKFLPVLGRHVVDVIERRDTVYTRLWKWRAGGPRPPHLMDLSGF